jgi:hypothetical protein
MLNWDRDGDFLVTPRYLMRLRFLFFAFDRSAERGKDFTRIPMYIYYAYYLLYNVAVYNSISTITCICCSFYSILIHLAFITFTLYIHDRMYVCMYVCMYTPKLHSITTIMCMYSLEALPNPYLHHIIF